MVTLKLDKLSITSNNPAQDYLREESVPSSEPLIFDVVYVGDINGDGSEDHIHVKTSAIYPNHRSQTFNLYLAEISYVELILQNGDTGENEHLIAESTNPITLHSRVTQENPYIFFHANNELSLQENLEIDAVSLCHYLGIAYLGEE